MEWISVKDRLPKIGDRVLVICEDGSYFAATLSVDPFVEGPFFEASYFPYLDVTHWMQLPEPPKQQQPKEIYTDGKYSMIAIVE